jgi:polysaccharide biosynthesis protein PelD
MMKMIRDKLKVGLKSDPLVEIILGYAVLTAINIFWFRKNMGFIDVNPHPYWIIILPLAARYGYRSGFWAGLTGGLLELALAYVQQIYMGFSFMFNVAMLKDPLIFVSIGALIGEIREIQKRRRADLESKYGELKESFEILKSHYTALSQAKQELDGSIISQEQTISTMYDAAQALRSLKEEDIYPAVMDMMKGYLGVEAASIFRLEDGKLYLKSAVDDAYPLRPQETDAEAGLMAKAIREGKLVTVDVLFSAGECDESGYCILAAIPIIDTSDRTLGVLNIEKLPFVKYNPMTLRMASLIADWSGAALENAMIYQDAKERDITDETTGAYSAEYLSRRLNEEYQRSRRYKTALSIVSVELVDFDQFVEDKRDEIMLIFSQLLQKLVRGVDLLFRGASPGLYVLLLPNTDAAGARILSGKLLKEIKAFQFKATADQQLLRIRYGISSFNELVVSPAHMLQIATENMHEDV